MGRTGSYLDGEYEVNLPGRQARYVPETELFVRCRLPIEDPTDVLALKAHETAFFHEHRLEFYRCLIDQRAAFRGMTGLVSSRVELFRHQFDVVQRVLQDPVQRYLLADEVGLGKTVEAGVILRQLLLDQPNANALVLVPPLIVDQWKQELEEKFSFGLAGEVEVYGTDRLPHLSASQRDLVILDEAQLVASLAWATSEEREIFKRFMEFSRLAKRLLLLSATPVLNNERDFLAMLHMLDPAAFCLEDFQEFRMRIAKRQEVGRALLALREGMSIVPLKAALKSLRKNFGDDNILDNLASQLESLLNCEFGTHDRDELIRGIRIHISETYRLHRRMLRNRRQNLDNVLLSVRQGKTTELNTIVQEIDNDERFEPTLEQLENWRAAAVNAAKDSQDESWMSLLKEVYFLFLEALDGSLCVLHEAVAARRTPKPSVSLVRNLGTRASLLWQCPQFPGEEIWLKELEHLTDRPSEDGDRLEVLKGIVRKRRSGVGGANAKVVVFASLPSVCRRVHEFLQTTFGENSAACYYGGQRPEDSEDSIESFRDRSSQCDILVCDRSAEVGRNLQFASVVVHLDLPWNPNRIEQRIGRLDRIGRKGRLTSHIFIGPETDGSVLEAWYHILRDGFGVFDESIASLQLFVDAMMPRVREAVWFGGANGLEALLSPLRVELENERVQIAEQDALDLIESNLSDEGEVFQRIDELDGEHSRLEGQMDAWVVKALNFRKNGVDGLTGAWHYRAAHNTLVPLNLLAGTEEDDSIALAILEPKTFRRETAVSNPEVGLLRIGDPFVDAMASYLDWDDRGKGCALWRCLSAWDPSEAADWMGFRFIFLVTADCDKAVASARRLLPEADETAIIKRGDSFLAPFLVDRILDIDGNHVYEPRILEAVSLPYNFKARTFDTNLVKEHLQVLDRVVDSSRWPDLCRDLRLLAETRLREDSDFEARIERAAEHATKKLSVQTQSLRLRVAELARKGSRDLRQEQNNLRIEQQLAQDILSGIRAPHVRLDSIAFYVLSGRPCPKEE
jgi:ATP-dependent helicase HepA